MDIFISEYVEGSSHNKAIELYNPTNSQIDLTAENYSIEIYFNGHNYSGTTIVLNGEIAPSHTWVVADDNAVSSILDISDQTDSGSFFNGNDTILLKKDGLVVDSIGRLGEAPSLEWGNGIISTRNNTLRRKSSVTSGDTNPDNEFDPTLEWDGFSENTFNGLGSHSIDDIIAPTLAELTPNDEATEIDIDANLSIQFDEAVKIGTGNIIIYKGSDDTTVETINVTSSQVSVSGDTVTIDPTDDLDASTSYYIQIDSGAIADLSDNNYAGISDTTTWNFTTAAGDTTPPSLNGLTPNDDATAVAVDANFAIQFDESVQVGTGNIQLKNSSDDTTVETINVTSSQVSVSGDTLTIDPTDDLDTSTSYYIQIDSGAIADLSDNNYAGISDTTTWNFTTAAGDTTPPSLNGLTPNDDATAVAVDANFAIQLDEAVKVGTGNIQLKNSSDDTTVETLDITSSQVSVSGDTVTVDFTEDLEASTSYYIQIDLGAIADLSDNEYVGISDTTTWNFTTESNTEEDSEDAETEDDSSEGASQENSDDSDNTDTGETEDDSDETEPENTQEASEITQDESEDLDTTEPNAQQIEETEIETSPTTPLPSYSNSTPLNLDDFLSSNSPATSIAEALNVESLIDLLPEVFNSGIELPSEAVDFDVSILAENIATRPIANSPTTISDNLPETDEIEVGGLMIGTAEAQTHCGESGDDTIAGFDGDDELCGNQGNDLIFGNTDNDTLDGGEGRDTLLAGQDNDVVLGGEDDDLVAGNYGNDELRGDGGDDLIFGNRGIDVLVGGDGEDTLLGGQDNDAVLGGDDDDRIAGERGNDDLRGEAGNDLLFGGSGTDELDGGEGDDTLFGGRDKDVLTGGSGDDVLSGDRGQDTLTGGTGGDIFMVGRDGDVVMDFQVGEDTIALADGLRFSDLLLRQDGDATIISRDSKTIARLLDVNASMLSESNFTSLV